MKWLLKSKTGSVLLPFSTETALSQFLMGKGNSEEWAIFLNKTSGMKRMGSWFPFRQNPMSLEYFQAQERLPMGDLALLGMMPSAMPDKSVSYYRFEIEAALKESDLHAWEVAEVMGMLPNIESVYNYLEERSLHQTGMLIRRLLSY